MPIISVAGQKGGAGKSTTALSLAAEYHARGLRVLVVDADDEQRTALTWGDVADEAEIAAPPVIRMGDAIRTQLPALAAPYEVVLIDCPGRNGRRTAFALGLSDLAILPIGPTGPEIWTVRATLDQVADVQAIRPYLDAAILITRKQPGTVIGNRARAALEACECDVLDTEVHYRVGYGEAITAGRGPTTYEPASDAAHEIRALADEVARRLTRRGAWPLPASSTTPTTRRRRKLHAVK